MKGSLAIFCTFLILVSCGKREQEKALSPVNITQLDNSISSTYIVAADDATEIVLTYKSIWKSEAVLFGLADDSKKIMKGMVRYNLVPKNQRIRFTVEIPLIDSYGNERLERVVSITYLTSELIKVNYENDNFLPQMMLDLYEKIWRIHPLADRLIHDYCYAEIAKYGDVFCSQER